MEGAKHGMDMPGSAVRIPSLRGRVVGDEVISSACGILLSHLALIAR